MSNIAEKIFEAVKNLPEQQATEVLDFVEFLKSKTQKKRGGRREKALVTLDKHMGLYDGSPFNREELHERP
ncbi:MAG: DUF2281 domain-containing protein [Methylococcaceae bacterium]|nr:DUF2281 domain-containing protein [Methylococcaceae bacterium]